MKDWRGVILVLAIAGMVFTLAILDPSLRLATLTSFVGLLGAVTQRSKMDAMVSAMLSNGASMSPPANPGDRRTVAIPHLGPLPTIIGAAGASVPPAAKPPDEK